MGATPLALYAYYSFLASFLSLSLMFLTLHFSPYTYLFLSILLIVTVSSLTLDSFLIYWVMLEIVTLLFIGVRYTLFKNSYSYLIIYFIIQIVSALGILVSYLAGLWALFTLFYFSKIALFPTLYWIVNIMYRFPMSVLFIVSTVYKVPSVVLFFQFAPLFSWLIISILLTTIILSSTLMYVSVDVKFSLIVSTSVSTCWIILSLYGPIYVFSLYFLLYTLSLYLVTIFLAPYRDIKRNDLYILDLKPISGFLALSTLLGLPPFPLFLVKLLILYNLYLFLPSHIVYLLAIFMLINVPIVVSFIQTCNKYLIHKYSSPSSSLFVRVSP